MKTKKELREEYRTMKFRVGIVGIVNKHDQRIFLQSSSDLDRAFNSDVFQLKAGMHPNTTLQKDWYELGPDSFEFLTVDELRIGETATPDEIKKDLKELLEMHLLEFRKSDKLLY